MHREGYEKYRLKNSGRKYGTIPFRWILRGLLNLA